MIAVGSTEQLSAQHTSTALDYLIRFLGAHVSHLDVLDAVLRKVGHFLVYGTLGLLLFRAWRYSVPAITRLKAIRFPQPAWTARWSLLAIAGAVLVAALDEFHQSFVPSRTSSIRDVALDAMGAAFFQLFLLALLYGKSQKISRH
jgi:VanZ family protein